MEIIINSSPESSTLYIEASDIIYFPKEYEEGLNSILNSYHGVPQTEQNKQRLKYELEYFFDKLDSIGQIAFSEHMFAKDVELLKIEGRRK